VKNNQIDQAIELFTEMQNMNVQMNTVIYTTMIKAFQKSYQLERALGIYEAMLSQMET
jgi:pentatricopeptide repeat protein